MEKSKQTDLNTYHSKEVLSNACSEIIENLLIKTYEEENPFRSKRQKKTRQVSSEETDADQFTSMESYPARRRTRKKFTKYRSLPEEAEPDSFTANEVLLPKIGLHNAPEIRYIRNVERDHVNPFKDLLAQNESFFYQNDDARKDRVSDNTLQPEMEDLEDQYHSSYEFTSECHLRNSEKRDTHTITDACGVSERVPLQQSVMINTSTGTSNPQKKISNPFVDLQGQGDHERIERLEYTCTLFGNRYTSLTVRVNFSFYAKLLAFLLTINTMFLFKSVIWTYLIPFLDSFK